MDKYDVAVIGGGPAGYLAAERLGDAGKKTVLIEKREVGGVCLNEGCIPTKALLYSAKIYNGARKGSELGVECGTASIKHGKVMEHKQNVVKTLVGGLSSTLKQKNVKVIYAQAGIAKGPDGFVVSFNGETLTADNIILATGSEPIAPNIPGISAGIKSGSVLTSREMLELSDVPQRLVIVGGGVIGLEMAAYYNAAGSNVSVVEMLNAIGGAIEPEASSVLQHSLEKAGVKFYLSSKVCDVSGNTAKIERNGAVSDLPYDKLLLSVGRRPSLNIPGLSEMCVRTERGAIVSDEKCATNIPGLYAAGDVNGKYLLAHVAYREAEVAVNNILGIADEMDYSAVPGVIYTQPEVAFAGITEEQAKNAGIRYRVRQSTINKSGRHIAEHGLSDGFIKLVLDEKTHTILGATLVSGYASEIIYALTLMIQNKIPVESIRRTIFPHPTVGEVIREVIFD